MKVRIEKTFTDKYTGEKRKRSFVEFNSQYTFDSFVVGQSNMFAYEIAKKVAADPGLQIQQFIDIRLILQKNIFSRNTNIRSTTLYIDSYIGRLDPKIPDSLFRIFKHQLPALGFQLRAGTVSNHIGNVF